ncbi:hypothetical protein [Cognataquiflexum nitidum]|uniref:hypothetical protein n=1 Tax=Cognataquiflexum nitidum TaxID=2922272 RepID=UPI001F132BF2|nr:hypothetical protein [Cognataquiflexum nitidum]
MKSKDGNDLKYTDFLISEIKSASEDQQKVKALASFAMVMASLSKEDAKIFGAKTGNDEAIRREYQSFLYLETIPISSEEEKLQVYLHAIKSIAFHLKVKEIPAYENLEMVNDYVENELSKNLQTLPKNDALRINQTQLHFLFSIALENYSKFLSVGILKEKQNPRFDQLTASRSKILPQAKNVSGLSDSLISMEGEAYLKLNQDMESLSGEYLDFASDLMGKIIEG